MTLPDALSRLGVLMKLGMLFNGTVGVILAVPLLRYVLSPVIRERNRGYESPLSLGSRDQFHDGQTRLATYRNPVANPLDERGLFEYRYKVEQGKLLIQAGEMPPMGAPTSSRINISARKAPCA